MTDAELKRRERERAGERRNSGCQEDRERDRKAPRGDHSSRGQGDARKKRGRE